MDAPGARQRRVFLPAGVALEGSTFPRRNGRLFVARSGKSSEPNSRKTEKIAAKFRSVFFRKRNAVVIRYDFLEFLKRSFFEFHS